MLAGEQALAAGVGDHGAVVGAEVEARVADREALFLRQGVEARAQAAVGGDAAGHHQGVETGLFDGAAALDGQGVGHRFLEGAGDVGLRLLAAVALAQGVEGEGLEAREAEVEAGPVGHGAREAVARRIALLGQGRHRGAAGIAEVQHLGGLVEGLAHGVVEGVAQHPVAADAGDLHQHRVPAGDQQGDEGKGGRIGLEHGRQQMAFHVVHRHRRHAKTEGQAAADGRPHQQRADEAGAGGVGHAFDIAQRQAGAGEHLPHQRQGLAHVIPRGQLRHHPAELGVQGHLAVEGVGQQAPIAVVEGDAGLVAGGLDSQNAHAFSLKMAAKAPNGLCIWPGRVLNLRALPNSTVHFEVNPACLQSV